MFFQNIWYKQLRKIITFKTLNKNEIKEIIYTFDKISASDMTEISADKSLNAEENEKATLLYPPFKSIRQFIRECILNKHLVENYDYKFDENGFLIYNHPLTSTIEPYYIPLRIHKSELF